MDAIWQLWQELTQALQAGTFPQLGAWSYLLLAVLVAVEGPIATLLGASGAAAGVVEPRLVFVAASLGNLTADLLWYYLGYGGKMKLLLRRQGLRVPVYPVSCGVDLARFHIDPAVDRVYWRRYYGLDPKGVLFLFVGRIDGEKRLEVLLHALQRTGRDDIQLAIAGRGTAVAPLKALAYSLGLGDRVHFTGFVPASDLPMLLNSVDLFTMPSEAELLSIATLEAMACGRPVLAARALALPELVCDRVNGRLFAPGDVADAAHCMVELAQARESWAAMGAASAERAHRHSLDATVRTYARLYERVLSNSTTIRPRIGGGYLQPLYKQIQSVVTQLWD